MMKILLSLLILTMQQLRAEEEVVQDALTVRALAKLEKRMEIEFKIPFPANFDPDAYRKQPLALIPVHGSNVCATRPVVNPYDEPRTVEWMIGPADPAKLGKEGLDCSIDLDERGDFSRLNLIVDWASDGTGNHQITRGEGESGGDFFERARLTYQFRAKKANDPASAQLFLAAFEKIASAIQSLRKEEARGK